MKSAKTVVFWFLILVSAMLLWRLVRATPKDSAAPEISYSQFMSEAEAGQVASVSVTGSRIQGHYRDGKTFHLVGPSNAGVYVDVLRSKGVEVWFKESADQSLSLQLLGTWAPLILLGALWFFMIRQIQRRGSLPGGGSVPPGQAT
jgi:cell division protease FtsH